MTDRRTNRTASVSESDPPPAIRLSYLICAAPRSGSNWLCEVLRSTDVAGRPDEYFWNPAIWQDDWSTADFAVYLDRVRHDGASPSGVFGIKLMWYYLGDILPRLAAIAGLLDADPPTILSASFPNPRYLWLTRRDKVRQAISHYRTLKTNAWRSTDHHPGEAAEPPFDRAAIDHLAQESAAWDQSWQQFFQQHGIEPMTIHYESLSAAPEQTVRSILNHLGLPPPIEPWPPPWRHQQQSDARTDE